MLKKTEIGSFPRIIKQVYFIFLEFKKGIRQTKIKLRKLKIKR